MLTDQRRRFVDEYLVDLDSTAAALRAGYSRRSAKQLGSRIRNEPEVAAAIDAAIARRAKRTEITQDRVVKELAKIGFADIRKAVKWQANVIGMTEDEDGTERLAVTNQVQLIDSDAIDDDTAAAIASIGQDSRGGLKINFHDKQGALVSLGRHLGMFKDKTEVTGAEGGPVKLEVSWLPAES